MIKITSDSVNEKDMTLIGVVEGRIIQNVRDTGLGSDSGSERITLAGEALEKYKEMMAGARETAAKKMIEKAEAMGADAIVCVRYSSAPGKDGDAEVTASGTAVKIQRGKDL